MTAALRVHIDTTPPERVAADALVAPFFETDRPLRGPAGRVDWRLCGLLSDALLETGFGGGRGEAVLLLSGGRVRAAKVIALGLGPRPGFGTRELERAGREASLRLAALGEEAAALALPAEAALGLTAREAARAAIRGFARGWVESGAAPEAIRLVVAPEERRDAEAGVAEAAALLAEARSGPTGGEAEAPACEVRLERGESPAARGSALRAGASP